MTIFGRVVRWLRGRPVWAGNRYDPGDRLWTARNRDNPGKPTNWRWLDTNPNPSAYWGVAQFNTSTIYLNSRSGALMAGKSGQN